MRPVPGTGHLGRLRAEYRGLANRLDAATVALPEPVDPGARGGWKEILEVLHTPEEAALAARMPIRPVSLEKLARRLGVAEALRAYPRGDEALARAASARVRGR